MSWTAGILGILAATCGVLIIISGNRKDELKDQREAQVKEQADKREQELRGRLSAAENATAIQTEAIATAKSRQEAAEQSLSELQERTRQRTVTAAQRSQLLRSLSEQENKGKVEIVFHSGDGEAGNLATTLYQTAKEAGWEVGLSPVTPAFRVSGLVIQVHDGNNPPLYARDFLEAFNTAEIPIKMESRASLPETEVYLFVGSKP
ncbi:MAG: hypothetical protein ABW007_27895 [Chitinophagaceae bacterium]